jgi:hypothetical protein
MKNVIFAAILIGFVSTSYGQMPKWNELDSFHTVLSKSFHPTESGNFKPLKENINLLVLNAKKWQTSIVPQGFNAPKAKPILVKLVKECLMIKSSITVNKPDSILQKQIVTLHDTFHSFVESCLGKIR